jgi:hypothetical protein
MMSDEEQRNMTQAKKQTISLAILSRIARGATALDACRAVLGRDLMDAVIDDLYRDLRQSAGTAPEVTR